MKIKYILPVLAVILAANLTSCNHKTEAKDADVAAVSTESAADTKTNAVKSTSDIPSEGSEKPLYAFDFPYDTEKIHEDLISYGESLGMVYDDSVTMKNANSVVKNETRAAATGKALETWCHDDLDSIAALARYQNIDPERVGFNITIYESPSYGGEYIIAILSETD